MPLPTRALRTADSDVVAPPLEVRLGRWQWRIFFAAWLTYSGFYLGRVNISVALPAIQSHFGWVRTEVGLIGSAFFWIYALGQLVNGWLGDRVSGRILAGEGIVHNRRSPCYGAGSSLNGKASARTIASPKRVAALGPLAVTRRPSSTRASSAWRRAM